LARSSSRSNATDEPEEFNEVGVRNTHRIDHPDPSNQEGSDDFELNDVPKDVHKRRNNTDDAHFRNLGNGYIQFVDGSDTFEMDQEWFEQLADEAGNELPSCITQAPRRDQHKRRRSRSESHSPPRNIKKAKRIQEKTKSRAKVADYEAPVNEIMTYANKFYSALLSTEDGYPDRMTEMTWAKRSWNEGCKATKISLAHNEELVKMVRSSCSNIILVDTLVF